MNSDQNLNDIYARLSSIGVRVTADGKNPAKYFADIEKTLLKVAESISMSDDTRLLSLALSWLSVHGRFIIVEKLSKLKKQYALVTGRDLPWLSAMAHYCVREKKLHKWKILASNFDSPVFLPPEKLTRTFMSKNGNVSWLEGTGIFVANDTVRLRNNDIMPPGTLAKINPQYRNRLIFGASWRADIITAIEEGMTSAVEIKNFTGCSYEPARRILNDYNLASAKAV